MPDPSGAPTGLPLGRGARGESVRDLQRRLQKLGYDLRAAEPGTYGEVTAAAVEQFQRDRGLDVDAICGTQTWSSLVEAGYRLGDRLLYLRSPMLRGDDVSELQHRLGALGFDAGRVDGILGPDTERALRDFQRNMGLTTDGVCGRDTLAALGRLRPTDERASVRMTREREALRAASRHLHERRIVIGEGGGLAVLATAVGRSLQDHGATVAVLHHPDPSRRAAEANEFRGDVYLGLSLGDRPECQPSYFAVPGFTSVGGERLAQLIAEEVPRRLEVGNATPVGTRLPVLRETKMPAVTCRLGPPTLVVARAQPLAAAFARAVERWVEEPVEGP